MRPFGATRNFVYRTVKLFEDTGGIIDHAKSGRPQVVSIPQAIRAVKARIERKPLASREIFTNNLSTRHYLQKTVDISIRFCSGR